MRAAVLREFGKYHSIEVIPTPLPGLAEVLVQVEACAICASDLHIIDGKIPTVTLPHITGHEIAGRVAAVGEDAGAVAIGTPVVVTMDIVCGLCSMCQAKRPNLCQSLVRIGFERPGGHAEYVVCPAQNLVSIPDELPLNLAAVVPDAVATMYHAVTRQACVSAGETVLFIGAGGLGLHGIQIAHWMGTRVACSEPVEEKRLLAQELGAEMVADADPQAVLEMARTLSGDGLGTQIVIDNVGTEATVALALLCVRPGGKVIISGYKDKAFSANFYDVLFHEKEIIGTRASCREDVEASLQLVAGGQIRPIVGGSYPLPQFADALDHLASGQAIGRLIITP